jgi:hypothetical protein
MASRISRREWVRGLPSAFGVGKYDRKQAHSASERSVGYVFLIGDSVQNHPNPLPYQTGSKNTRTPVATVAVALIAGMSPLMRWAVLSLGVARWQAGRDETLIWQAEGETHFVSPTSLIARQAQCRAYGLFTVSESSCYSDSPAPGGPPPPSPTPPPASPASPTPRSPTPG